MYVYDKHVFGSKGLMNNPYERPYENKQIKTKRKWKTQIHKMKTHRKQA